MALAEAIEARIKGPNGTRQGQRTDKLQETFPEVDAGQTRDIAAAKAGLGSGKTLEAAQKVVERGIPARGAFLAHLTAEKHNKRQSYTMLQVQQAIEFIALVCCVLLR